MSTEPDDLVLQLLRDMHAEMAGMRVEIATRTDIADLRSEMGSLRAGVASDLIGIRREIVGTRKDVGEYNTSVTGHGIIISESEARLRRVEQHLDLPPLDAHRARG